MKLNPQDIRNIVSQIKYDLKSNTNEDKALQFLFDYLLENKFELLELQIELRNAQIRIEELQKILEIKEGEENGNKNN